MTVFTEMAYYDGGLTYEEYMNITNTSCSQFSIFFSTMLGCFQNPSSLIFRQVCIVPIGIANF
jgi:hypothetical protein